MGNGRHAEEMKNELESEDHHTCAVTLGEKSFFLVQRTVREFEVGRAVRKLKSNKGASATAKCCRAAAREREREVNMMLQQRHFSQKQFAETEVGQTDDEGVK